MATKKDLDTQVNDLNSRVTQLATTNSNLIDEVAVLKQNYNKLVEDVNSRLKVVHDKLFRT